MEDLSGRSFGPYRIVAPLGAGGMAAVYKAYQPAVDRHVALKVLPRHFAQDREFIGRFEQEAKILASLQHPHILPVHDFGESDGFTFIVMPFIKTGTLADVIDQQPLPLDQITRVISQVGDALDYAHARGLVHRDVKPSNILIDERGNCLLADFGIAKILEGADNLTVTGGLVGTPKYISPEQGMGQDVDGRSDLYSLGVVLYEMATGRVPYDAETPVAVVVKHIRDPLPLPRTVNAEMPEALERVILRALHKEPSDRFATAAAMIEMIEPIVALGSATGPGPGGETTLQAGGIPPLPLRAGSQTPNAETAATVVTTPPASSGAGRTSAGRRWRNRALAAGALVMLVLLWFLRPTPDPGTQDTQPSAASLVSEIPTPPGDQPRQDDARALANPGTPDTVGDEASRAAAADATLPTATAIRSSDTDGAPEATAEGGTGVGAGTAPGANGGAGSLLATALDTNGSERRGPPSDVTPPLAGSIGAAAGRAAKPGEGYDGDPFPDLGDGTLLDQQVGLRWTTTGNPRQGTDGFLWTDASAYCQGLALGGNSNWRLPTQPELDSVLQRLDPTRYPWGVTLWSSDRAFGDPNRLWVTNSPLYAPEWSSAVRDASARRLAHRAVCVTPDTP